MILNEDGYDLGYINKGLAPTIGAKLRNKTPYKVEVYSITGGEDGLSFGCEVSIKFKEGKNV